MKIREINPKSGDVLLVPGDIHFDLQDDSALDLMLLVAVDRRVNRVCLVGDTFESSGISRHARLRRRFRINKSTLASERRAATPWLRALAKLVRSNRKKTARAGGGLGGLDVLTGNHEHWWSEIQDEYPGLTDTPWHELYGDLFDQWHVHAEHTALKYGPLLVCHGHRLRGSLSRSSAATVLANYPGQNTLYGHTHRVDSCITPSYKYGAPVRHGAWTIGTLKRWDVEIQDEFLGLMADRHLQGFALVNFYEVEGEMRFGVDQVTVDRAASGRPYAIVGGTYYEV